jgi:hypothetical protein
MPRVNRSLPGRRGSPSAVAWPPHPARACQIVPMVAMTERSSDWRRFHAVETAVPDTSRRAEAMPDRRVRRRRRREAAMRPIPSAAPPGAVRNPAAGLHPSGQSRLPQVSRLRARACCSGPVKRQTRRPPQGGFRRFVRPASIPRASAAARRPVPYRAYHPPAGSRRQPCAVSVPSVFLSTRSCRLSGPCRPGDFAARHARTRLADQRGPRL